jgi:hypothetical protein
MAISTLLKSVVNPIFEQAGQDVVGSKAGEPSPAVRQSRIGVDVNNLPPDFDQLSVAIFAAVDDYTQTSPESVNALVQAVQTGYRFLRIDQARVAAFVPSLVSQGRAHRGRLRPLAWSPQGC